MVITFTLLAALYGVLFILSVVPSKVSQYVLPATLLVLTLNALGVL